LGPSFQRFLWFIYLSQTLSVWWISHPNFELTSLIHLFNCLLFEVIDNFYETFQFASISNTLIPLDTQIESYELLKELYCLAFLYLLHFYFAIFTFVVMDIFLFYMRVYLMISLLLRFLVSYHLEEKRQTLVTTKQLKINLIFKY
jgi:hypothetical protein